MCLPETSENDGCDLEIRRRDSDTMLTVGYSAAVDALDVDSLQVDSVLGNGSDSQERTLHRESKLPALIFTQDIKLHSAIHPGRYILSKHSLSRGAAWSYP